MILLFSFFITVVHCQIGCLEDFVVSNGTDNYFTVFTQNKTCKCDNFVGDGSKLTNVATASDITYLKNRVAELEETIKTLRKDVFDTFTAVRSSFRMPKVVMDTGAALTWVSFSSKCMQSYNESRYGVSTMTFLPNVGNILKRSCDEECITKAISIGTDSSVVRCSAVVRLGPGGNRYEATTSCSDKTSISSAIGSLCCCSFPGISLDTGYESPP